MVECAFWPFGQLCPCMTRLSYKDKAAIIEAAKKGGGKEAVREKMMSEYQISRSAYYAIFRDFEPKMATVQPNAKSDKGVSSISILLSNFKKIHGRAKRLCFCIYPTLALATSWSLYPDSCFCDHYVRYLLL